MLVSIIILVCYSSCSYSESIEENVRKEVRISASFENLSDDSKVTTRAVDNAWESGDAIGVFMKKAGVTLEHPALSENAKYTTAGTSSFTPARETDKLYYPFDKSDVDFISYYPYTASLNGMNYEIDVADQSNLSDIDLLYSNNIAAVNFDNVNINLNFAHQLTKVVLKITTNYTGKDLSTLSAKITNVNTKASFSLVDGTITAASDPADVFFYLNSEKTLAQAIVLPESNLTNKKLVLSIDGTNYSYPLSSSTTITSFKKSQQCEYTITIEPTHGPILNGVTAEITNWTTVSEDITVTEDPSETSPEEGVDGPEGENAPSDPGDGVGDGTQEYPYTIAQAKELSVGQTVWVKGYIVGSYKGSEFFDFTINIDEAEVSKLALADSSSEVVGSLTFPVNYAKDASLKVKQSTNLKDNPSNLGKEIRLKGEIYMWHHENTLVAFKSVKEAILDGVLYKGS